MLINKLGYKSAINNYGDRHMPYSSSYRPELDVTEELGEDLINRYQQLIVVLRWSIELGRFDILIKLVSISILVFTKIGTP